MIYCVYSHNFYRIYRFSLNTYMDKQLKMITRDEAIRSGLNKFCVGAVCRRGHVAERYVSGYGCVACALLKTPEFLAWRNMLARCYNPKHPNYKNYGGRGITVCGAWRRSFEAFLVDVGPKPHPDLQLHRFRNDENYTTKNVLWSTIHVQSRNRRTSRMVELDGRELILNDAAKLLGVAASSIRARAKRMGASLQAAVTDYACHGRRRRPNAA